MLGLIIGLVKEELIFRSQMELANMRFFQLLKFQYRARNFGVQLLNFRDSNNSHFQFDITTF